MNSGSFESNLIGEPIFINEPMNRGLPGKIRMITVQGFEILFLIEIIGGAAAGSLISLHVDQVTLLTVKNANDFPSGS